jgi:hypothetical protein
MTTPLRELCQHSIERVRMCSGPTDGNPRACIEPVMAEQRLKTNGLGVVPHRIHFDTELDDESCKAEALPTNFRRCNERL